MNTHPNLSPDAPIIIAFASPKGGVGKSTLCLVMAAALTKRGYPVHVLDLDQNRVIDGWARAHAPEIPGLTIEALPETGFMPRIQTLYREKRGFILIDVAGSLDTTALGAATIANLAITPTGLDVNEITEAFKLYRAISDLGRKVGKPIAHRLLLNRVPTLLTASYQKAILDNDVPRSGMARFETMLHARSAYPETFSTGQPPHYANAAREPIRKAIEELDCLTDEVLALVLPVEQKAAA
jgi:chromosome partitioning protein